MSKENLQHSLQTAIEGAQQLQKLLAKLIENGTTGEQLESLVNGPEYLQLLGTLAYTQNCVVHSYAHLKDGEIPEQFKDVKIYYEKVQEALKPKQQKKNTNEVAKRMIKRSLG